MSEPASTAAAAQAFASSVTAVFLALIGVPPLALTWAFIGAGAMLVFSTGGSKRGELISVAASGFVGAAGGQYGAIIMSDGAHAAMIVLSMVIGAGAKPLLSAAISRIEKTIGKDTHPGDGK